LRIKLDGLIVSLDGFIVIALLIENIEPADDEDFLAVIEAPESVILL
jgi:hypothetical protein